MTEISPLRRRMIEDMTVRNLSPATQRSYVHAVSNPRGVGQNSSAHMGQNPLSQPGQQLGHQPPRHQPRGELDAGKERSDDAADTTNITAGQRRHQRAADRADARRRPQHDPGQSEAGAGGGAAHDPEAGEIDGG